MEWDTIKDKEPDIVLARPYYGPLQVRTFADLEVGAMYGFMQAGKKVPTSIYTVAGDPYESDRGHMVVDVTWADVDTGREYKHTLHLTDCGVTACSSGVWSTNWLKRL